jgi:mono/diheme cytochrome c family protein
MSPPAAAPPETGVQLFAGKCASCHNADGSGGMSFGSVKSADLRAPGLEQTYKTDALLLRAILDGKDETGQPLHAPMPVWRGQLSTASAQAIVAYLHTLHS